MLKKHGIDLEEPGLIRKRTLRRKELEMVMGKKWLEDGDGLLTWRDKKRRKMALSVCGCVSRCFACCVCPCRLTVIDP
jgi:hypothetical protein